MAWTLRHFPRQGILLARIQGDYGPEAAVPFLQALGLAHREHLPRAQLIDRRRSDLKLGTMDIFTHPQAFRQAGIGSSGRIAVVVTALTADEKFMETVFSNQGYKLKVFDDWRHAVAWVKEWRRLS